MERQRHTTSAQPSVRSTFSPTGPWRPAVVARLARTLGVTNHPHRTSMPRYVAFLRGVSPLNAKMSELKHCFESAGFEDVRTLLSSGNVAFSTGSSKEPLLARKAEAAMQARLGRTFSTIVRSASHLQKLIEADPFKDFQLAPKAKPVVTFLPEALKSPPKLPIELDGAFIHEMRGLEVFVSYVPNQKGPVFMALLERTFGKSITTRTLETVRRCAMA